MNKKDKFLVKLEKEVIKLDKKFSKLLEKKKPVSLYEPCNYILSSGGKRLRPYLLLVAAKSVGGEFKNAYNAAMAVEILHNFTLVHDDIMDNADKRRGRTTLHVRNDLSTAILAGDTLFAVAYESLLKDCNENHKEVVSTFTDCIIKVCEGQSLDKEFEIRKDVNLSEYKTMIHDKTAALLEASCSIGAQIANGTKEEVKALSQFGKNLGLAFQIQDDLLDIMGNEEEFGKSVGIDLVDGKKTFLFLTALEKAKDDDLELLKKLVNNNGIKKNQIKKYKNLYIKLKIIEIAEKEIKNYTNKALNSLNILKDSEAKNTLIWLANFLIKRSK
ncbi:MAG: polyprenyl synthetase family protein [Melioribacteraceae bacterium]|nr:polyprenyl synthetase family protein [Melioribacteraceae bacterium]